MKNPNFWYFLVIYKSEMIDDCMHVSSWCWIKLFFVTCYLMWDWMLVPKKHPFLKVYVFYKWEYWDFEVSISWQIVLTIFGRPKRGSNGCIFVYIFNGLIFCELGFEPPLESPKNTKFRPLNPFKTFYCATATSQIISVNLLHVYLLDKLSKMHSFWF